jgi:hypothetical protein
MSLPPSTTMNCRRGPRYPGRALGVRRNRVRSRSGSWKAGRSRESGTKPFGFRLPGVGDCLLNSTSFVGSQPHREHCTQRFFLWQRWASHLLWHTQRISVYKKCLTTVNLMSTKSRALKRGFKPFQESARTCLERLVTKHTRLQPGRAKKRLAMNTQAQQGAEKRLSRSLKIERTGDFYRKKIIPRIRLNGKWLEAAGFKPGHRVEICVPESGTMVLRFVEQVQNGEMLR